MKQQIIATLIISPGNDPWFGFVKFLTERDDDRFYKIKDFVKRIPGSTYLAAIRSWQVPVEMLDKVEAYAKDMHFKIVNIKPEDLGEIK